MKLGGPSASPRRLYVVERAPGKLYVGSSAHRGRRAGRLTGHRRFDLEPGRSWTGEPALRAERALARRLRREGYLVRQNPSLLSVWGPVAATFAVMRLIEAAL